MMNYFGKMFEDVVVVGFILMVYGGDSELDFVGCYFVKVEEVINVVEEVELILQDEGFKKVGWVFIVGGVSEDECIVDCGSGDWIVIWMEVNIL